MGEFLVRMKTAAKLAPTHPCLCHLSTAAGSCAVFLYRPIILSCQPALGSKQVPLPAHLYPMPSLLSPLSHFFPFFSKPSACMRSDDFTYIYSNFLSLVSVSHYNPRTKADVGRASFVSLQYSPAWVQDWDPHLLLGCR